MKGKRKLLVIFVVGFLMIEATLIKIRHVSAVTPKIVINEVCALSGRAIKDGVNAGSDYIELYNCYTDPISLKDWSLTDDPSKSEEYRLPDYIIQPGGYLVLYANKKEAQFCLPFKISQAGEKLFLYEPDGTLADSIVIPELRLDQTYARMTDGDVQWDVKSPTPNSANANGAVLSQIALSKPKFSAEGGFYEEAFELILSAEKGQTIYYTLDGSIPTVDSQVYEKPIRVYDMSSEPNKYVSRQRVVPFWMEYVPDTTPVDKGMVVRAIAVDDTGRVSEIGTETYFVGQKEYEHMTVMSIVAEPEELYGADGIFVTGKQYDEIYERGEYVDPMSANFQQRGRGWEVEANMEFFEKGKTIADQTVGIRVQGNSGRKMAQKRLSIFAREEYSASEYFDQEFLGKKNVHSVMLNEYVSNVALPQLVEDRAIGIQDSRKEPVAVFINGEYWYTRYMMEKYNSRYIEEEFGVARENVLILKNGVPQTGVEEHAALYVQVQDVASDQSLTSEQRYEKLSEMIDLQSFIDFFASSIYLCNMNMNENENYVLWRAIEPENGTYGDTRWRWLMYDVEAIESLRLEYYGYESRAQINSFSQPQDWTDEIINENTIYQGLKDCETFRRQFVTTFLDIANVNFAPERVEKLLEEYDEDLTWQEDFFLKRFDYITEDLKEEFMLEGTLADVTLKVSDEAAGQICLNTTMPELTDGAWTGRYFTDYPINVTAAAKEGYRFVRWEGSYTGTEAELELPLPSDGMILEAIFEKIE